MNIEYSTLKEGLPAGRQQHVGGSVESGDSTAAFGALGHQRPTVDGSTVLADGHRPRPTLPNMPALPALPALSTINSQPSTVPGGHRPHATAEARLAKAFWKAIGKTFRGEIWENTALVPMGRGYANDGKVFDIESACYLKPVQRAIRSRPYGKFVCLAAVQMLKTFGAIEEPAGFFIEHVPGDMTIYLSADTSAFDQAKSRLMPRLKSIPGVRSQIEAAEAANRFDITTAEFYLPGMVLRVWPLNETTTQRITLRYVLISDAFLSGRTGLIKQAIRRTTQHNTTSIKDYKVVIESQGGEDGDDFDEEWKSTNMQFLHVVCPMCGEGQPFEWHREREEGFLATLTREKIKEIEERIIGERRTLNAERRTLNGGIGSVEPGGSTAGGMLEHSTFNIQHSTLKGESESGERRTLKEGESVSPGGETAEGNVGTAEHSTLNIQHSTFNEGLPAGRQQHVGGSVSPCGETAEFGEICGEGRESVLRNPFSAVSHAIGFAVGFATAELSAGLLHLERRHAGMKRGAEDLIKLPDGGYNEAEVLRQTYYECFHCGSAWPDTPAMRRQIDQSSYYVPSNPSALWENVGFSWPSWAGQRLAWGGEFNMLGFLRATKTYEEKGNVEPLRQWYQKSAARPWNNRLSMKMAERPGATIYDEKEKIPGELCRISATDIQFHLSHMVYVACAVGDGVPPRLLHYEWVKPPSGLTEHEMREFCKNRVRELDKEFGIEQQNSMKDAAHEPDLVREWAAEDAVWAKIREGGRVVNKWVSYGLLLGDDKVSYRWAHPGRKQTWERFKQYAWVFVDAVKEGRRVKIPIHHRLWSNPSIKDIAERWRDGISAPKLQVHEKWLANTSKEGLWAQLTSERKLPWKGRTGKLRYDNEGRPNHAWDAFCMIIERMDELGYLNSFGVATEEEDGS